MLSTGQTKIGIVKQLWVGAGENKKVNCKAALTHRTTITPVYFIILGHQKPLFSKLVRSYQPMYNPYPKTGYKDFGTGTEAKYRPFVDALHHSE